MTILQLECFVEAAKTENISRAAARLFLSQQSVSKHIRALEKELGFPLFARHNMGVRLTEEGQVLFAVWEDAIVRHRTALDRARDLFRGAQNTIKIGILDCGAFNDTLVENIMTFNERFPDISMEYEFMLIRDLLEDLSAGKLHMAFVYATELSEDVNLHSLNVSSSPIRVGIYCSRKDPMANRKFRPALLEGKTFGVLADEVSRDYRDRVEDFLEKNGVSANSDIRTYNARHNLGMALVTGKCITLVYETMYAHMKDKLAFLPIPEMEEYGTISLVWKDEKFTAKARNLAALFMEEA